MPSTIMRSLDIEPPCFWCLLYSIAMGTLNAIEIVQCGVQCFTEFVVVLVTVFAGRQRTDKLLHPIQEVGGGGRGEGRVLRAVVHHMPGCAPSHGPLRVRVEIHEDEVE
eukprot:EG_transcript_33132